MNKLKLSTLITILILTFSYFTYNAYASKTLNNTLQTTNNVYWTYGIKALETNGINSKFNKDSYLGYTDYKSSFDPNYGYYDINKTENREGDNSLCFAVSASNALHWWFDINKDNIDKLFLDNPNYDLRLDEINNYRISPTTHYDSNIYNMYHKRYFNRVGGYWPDILIDQFINGYYPKAGGGVNSEGWDGKDLLEKGPDKLGGYFFNTFKEHKLTDRMYVNYNDLNKYLYDFINNKTLVMLTFVFGNTAHVITVWGVEYDSNNNLCAIYYTDSDDEKGIGMVRSKVVNRNGYAYLTNKDDNTGGSKVDAISILRSGDEYFKPHTHEYSEPVWNYSDINNINATFTCKLDPTHVEIIKADVTNHITDSTCTKEGESYSLGIINFNNKEYISDKFNITKIALKQHHFSEWKFESNPTCTTSGLKTKYCLDCHYKESKIIPKLSHNLLLVSGLNPTCETDGIKKHYMCQDCNILFDLDKKTIINNIVINKLGHNADNKWISVNNHHYHKCLNGCGTHLDEAKCSGGKATTTNKPICDTCHSEYGQKLENILKYEITIDNNIITSNTTKNIINILLDNNKLNNNDYTINDNKVIINEDIINNLDDGKHKLVINYEDGYGLLEFEIKNNNLALYITIPIISISILSLIVLVIRKKLI